MALSSTIQMNKKSRLNNDQTKLKIVCDDICDNIYPLLDAFGLEYRSNNKMISMSCPIHGGDNMSAINLYPEGDRYRGNWKCRTHGCEQIFKSSVIGFVRGILSHQKHGWEEDGDKTCSFNDALEFCLKFINKDLKNIKVSKTERDKKSFTSTVSYLSKDTQVLDKTVQLPTRDQVRKNLKMSPDYYIQRGYSLEILDKYDVGLCDNPTKEMYNRIVVPIYNNDYTHMIACSGRSISNRCNQCSSYHSETDKCPSDEKKWLYPKWKHSANFKSQNSLYNFWFAKEHIMKSSQVIIVESPGNVWRLEENGIHNSVAIFGSSLSDRQKILLDSSGAMTIVILTDNDEAGRKAADQIKSKCQNTYRVFVPSISKPDVGEMTSEEINTEIKPYLESIV
jgi:5S rRNA maturation endonuclease (ribonuclease M5)